MFRKKWPCVYKCKLQLLPSAKDNENGYIYIERKKIAKSFYIKKIRNFTKSKTARVTFYGYKNPDTLRYVFFLEKFRNWRWGGEIFI